MKITILDCDSADEEEVIIKCRSVDEDIVRLIRKLRDGKDKLTVFSGENMQLADVCDVFYFEAVDERVFAYFEKDVFEVRNKLYELEESLSGKDFFRASKSVIMNLSKVEHFSPSFNGRIDACLKNGEHIMVSRSFVPLLKKLLGIKR